MNRVAASALYLLSTFLSFAILARPASADTVRYEEFSPSVAYDSNWALIENSGLSGGSLISTDVAGAKVTVTFTGTGISWVSYACTCAAGVGRISLDGVVHGTASAYDTTRTPQATIYRIENLANATHVLTIEATGQSRSFTDGAVIAVDAFDVIEPGTTVIQEHAPAISYEGTWTDFSDPTTSGGNLIGANTAGAAAVVNFTGAAIAWIGYQCPCSSGVSRVLVDGVVANDRVFVNSTERLPQKEHYRVTGLPYGNHTLRIELTGETVGDGPWVLIDAFHVMSSSSGPDTEKPTVTLTSPTREDILHGTINLTAEASDNVGVAVVRFYVSAGNGSGLVGEDATPPYSMTWDSTLIPNTTQAYVVAQAFDVAGNVGSSGGIAVPIQQEDYIRPTAALTQPTAGATLSGVINVTATASDNVGVRGVWFRTSAKGGGHTPFFSDFEAPYATTLNTLPLLNGESKFSVHARDLVDTPSALSPSEEPFVMVTINNSLAPGRIVVDDTDSAVVFAGSWTTLQEIPDFRVYEWNTAQASDQAGAMATLTFSGTGVRWRSLRCNVCGMADVSIDGGTAVRVNLAGTSPLGHVNQQRTEVVYESPALANGSHTITITAVTGGQQILVDAFDVLRP